MLRLVAEFGGHDTSAEGDYIRVLSRGGLATLLTVPILATVRWLADRSNAEVILRRDRASCHGPETGMWGQYSSASANCTKLGLIAP